MLIKNYYDKNSKIYSTYKRIYKRMLEKYSFSLKECETFTISKNNCVEYDLIRLP